MIGLLALLNDVAGVAKVAAASVGDVVANAANAGVKAACAVIDDAAVTPKYIQGIRAERELPIIWEIANGSCINKPIYLLSVGLVRVMLGFMKLLTSVGAAAMLWVGGLIVIHGLEKLGFGWLGHRTHDRAAFVGQLVPLGWSGRAAWVAKVVMDGVFGVAPGLVTNPVVTKIIVPLVSRLKW